jgi:hypothetical protein
MNRKELLERLHDLDYDTDTERAHEKADTALLQFINDYEITSAFNAIKKWYA